VIPLRDVIPSRTRPITTVALLALNACVFLLQFGLDEREMERFVRTWGLIPADFSWTSVVTSMFVHGGLMHFAGNMLYLWIFGDNVEDRMGHVKFLIFYLLCGILATAAHILVAPNSVIPSLGASGAIAGVLGGYLILFPRGRIKVFQFGSVVEMPALIVIGLWGLLQFLGGFGSLSSAGESGGVAYMAHVGGFIAGMALVFLFRNAPRPRVERYEDSR
jgi:membrane associated rhomboid family serine protease